MINQLPSGPGDGTRLLSLPFLAFPSDASRKWARSLSSVLGTIIITQVMVCPREHHVWDEELGRCRGVCMGGPRTSALPQPPSWLPPYQGKQGG